MRTTCHIFLFLLCCLFGSLSAQKLRPADLVAAENFFTTVRPFVPTDGRVSSGLPEMDRAKVTDYTLFDLDTDAVATWRDDDPAALELEVPARNDHDPLTLQLVRVNPFAADFRVTESHKVAGLQDVDYGLHYRGIVAGEPESLVSLSLIGGEVMAVISRTDEQLVLGKVQIKGDDRHLLYNEQDLPIPDGLGVCATPDGEEEYTRQDLTSPLDQARDANNCVGIYLEADYSIFQIRGSSASVNSYITGLFNQMATLYANDLINLTLTEVFVWTQQDPYNSNSSSGNLTAFLNTRQSFNGDLAGLVSYQASGGIAYVNAVCSPSYAYSFSSIDNSYQTVPTYSWSVNVLAHEFGHLMGSQHTHACAWNGNNTAIDGCYSPEGGCAQPGLPSGGGTIMSYCHLTSAGVNFTKGFGPQPKAVIQNRVYNGNCLSSCSTGGGGGGGNGGTGGGGGDNGGGGNGDGGGGTGPECTTVTFNILTDNYPAETTWRITNSGGSVVASGGSYRNAGTNYGAEVCLPDGCYTLRVSDSYGDGICCAYGSGNYKLTNSDDGTILAQGGAFGSSESTEFCLEYGSGDDGDDGECLPIDFTEYSVGSYGGSQDRGTFVQLDDNSIQLQNNAWKAILLNYTVTPNTVIEFEFGSTIQGEIHGIGFDNNNSISSNRTFRLYGTQNWGIGTFATYTNLGYWMPYTIPVGEFYTGTFNRLFFTVDHDSGARNGTAFFRNIRIYEGNNCGSYLPAGDPIVVEEVDPDLSVFPNPANDRLNLRFTVAKESAAEITVFDMAGRLLLNRKEQLAAGRQTLPLQTSRLLPGTYLVRIQTGEWTQTRKFTVVR